MKKNIHIIDNFFDENTFSELNSLKLDDVEPNKVKVYHNKIYKNDIDQSCIDKNLIQSIHKNYHSKLFNLLKNISEEKTKIYDYSDLTIIKTGKNYKFPIHDDTPNKLLSGVIYLYPTNNSGTIFYKNRKGDEKEMIDWKQNRAVFFSRSERETWHSYEGDGISDRVALVYNLMTNNIKKVYEIEGKNYFFGNLRWKLNPYLYRYLNFYI